jgi:hypothetical protein
MRAQHTRRAEHPPTALESKKAAANTQEADRTYRAIRIRPHAEQVTTVHCMQCGTVTQRATRARLTRVCPPVSTRRQVSMFKRKATAAEKQAVEEQEEFEIALINIQGGFTSMSEEHQLNRARMVLQATEFATYDRLMLGSIPTRRKDFQYIIGVYKKSVAEKILQREVSKDASAEDTPKAMRVVEIVNVAGKRAHAVEAIFDMVDKKGEDRDTMSDLSTDMHEYTLVIMEHSVEHIKQLKFRHVDLTHWDWTPLSNGEIEIEAEIYDPRQITTMQYEESMNVLGLSVTWSTASHMLPSACSIEVPASYKMEAQVVPSPDTQNSAGMWKLMLKGAGLITKCMTMQDNEGQDVQKDVPMGAKVMMRLIWTGTEDPSTNEWPVLPLWV